MLLCLCLFWGSGFQALGLAAEKIILVGSLNPQQVAQIRWVVSIYTEVFHRLGYEFEYVIFPLPRLSAMVNSGEVDGEIQRPAEYQANHPNLIRVEEPHGVVRYIAYAVKPGIVLHGWDSLRNTNYKVEYRRGISTAKAGLTSVVSARNLSDITSTKQGLKKLLARRTDIYVDLDYIVTTVLKQLDPAAFDAAAIYQAGIMVEKPVFSYLNKLHIDLAPKIANALKAMKQEGLFEQYRKTVYGEDHGKAP